MTSFTVNVNIVVEADDRDDAERQVRNGLAESSLDYQSPFEVYDEDGVLVAP